MTVPAGWHGPTAETGGFRAVDCFRLAARLPEATHVTGPAARWWADSQNGWLPGGRSLPFGGQAAGSQPRHGSSGSARADSQNGWFPGSRPLPFGGLAAGGYPRHGSSGSARADSQNGWLPGGRPLPSGGQAAGSHPRHGSSGTLVGKLHKEQAMFLAGGTPAFSLTIGTEKGNLLHREHIWLGGKFP